MLEWELHWQELKLWRTKAYRLWISNVFIAVQHSFGFFSHFSSQTQQRNCHLICLGLNQCLWSQREWPTCMISGGSHLMKSQANKTKAPAKIHYPLNTVQSPLLLSYFSLRCVLWTAVFTCIRHYAMPFHGNIKNITSASVC